jgi:dUTP pyrophosphatase
MQPLNIDIQKLEHAKDLPLPAYGTDQSAGLDLVAAVDASVSIKPGERYLVPCGIVIAIPSGYEGQIRPRSGLALKHGITILNAPGTVDADYRGEIKAIIINHGQEPFLIERGMRIAQLVIAPYSKIDWCEVSDITQQNKNHRGGGFGSTGLYATGT